MMPSITPALVGRLLRLQNPAYGPPWSSSFGLARVAMAVSNSHSEVGRKARPAATSLRTWCSADRSSDNRKSPIRIAAWIERTSSRTSSHWRSAAVSPLRSDCSSRRARWRSDSARRLPSFSIAGSSSDPANSAKALSLLTSHQQTHDAVVLPACKPGREAPKLHD